MLALNAENELTVVLSRVLSRQPEPLASKHWHGPARVLSHER